MTHSLVNKKSPVFIHIFRDMDYAFMFFAASVRDAVRQMNPDASFAEWVQAVRAQWDDLDSEERAVFEERGRMESSRKLNESKP